MLKLIKGKQVYSSHELVGLLGNRTAIQRMVKADQLMSLGSGYYSTFNIEPGVAQIHVVAQYFPKAVLSGITALGIHGLSDERLDKVTVDIPLETTLANRFLSVRRVARSRLMGIIQMDYFGKNIRIYDRERALCDAYRIDRTALFFKALKRYIKQGLKNSEHIARYDKVLGTKVMRALQQELADG